MYATSIKRKLQENLPFITWYQVAIILNGNYIPRKKWVPCIFRAPISLYRHSSLYEIRALQLRNSLCALVSPAVPSSGARLPSPTILLLTYALPCCLHTWIHSRRVGSVPSTLRRWIIQTAAAKRIRYRHSATMFVSQKIAAFVRLRLSRRLPPMHRKPAVHGCTGSPPPPLLECSMADR